MGRPLNVMRRPVVEGCEILKVSDTAYCRGLGIGFTTVATRGSLLSPALFRTVGMVSVYFCKDRDILSTGA